MNSPVAHPPIPIATFVPALLQLNISTLKDTFCIEHNTRICSLPIEFLETSAMNGKTILHMYYGNEVFLK